EPPAQGGWNIFHTWSTSFDTMTPAVSSVLGGGGEKAWFGWPTSEPIEKLRTQFVREPDAAKRKAIADEVQKIAYDEVLYVPWGRRRQAPARAAARGEGARRGAGRVPRARADDVLSALVDGGSGRDRRLLRDRDARAGNEAALRRGAAARPRLLPRLRGEDGR